MSFLHLRLEFGVMGEAGDWFQAYLSGRRQRVCIGKVNSPWLIPRFGVPQGSILEPLMFVLFVNDLPRTGRHGSINMYADDTTLYVEAETAEQAMEALGSDAQSTLDWYRQNRLIVNLKKTHLMVFGRKHRKNEISGTKLVLNNIELQPEQSVVYLGVTLDDQLKWDDHVMKLRSKCFGGQAKLRRLCKDLHMTVRKKLYCALIQPHTDYCSVVWHQLTLEQEKKVETIQNIGMRIILGAPRSATGTEMREKLQWTTLAQRRRLLALKLAYKCIHRMGPVYLHNKFQSISSLTDRQTRGSSSGKLYLSRPRTEFYKKSFEYSAAKLWNSLPSPIRTLTDIGPFTTACKAVLNVL